jgi:catechol 2,3-dioxygenase-like lactoylglutathione lyase family enzyme
MKHDRRNWLMKIGSVLACLGLARSNASGMPKTLGQLSLGEEMKLGAFSVSLNVKDLNASREFYEGLGFTVFGGGMKKNYLIMKSGNALIGLFHGMFEKTILTFNPGWDENATKLEKFDDVREIQRRLKAKGIKLVSEADEKTTGPASIILLDPDGNQILFDQHV